MVLAALVPLALGISGDLYVVAEKVLKASEPAIVLAGASLLFFFAIWFGLTLGLRARSSSAEGALRVSPSVR
jgi:hypothetical protein